MGNTTINACFKAKWLKSMRCWICFNNSDVFILDEDELSLEGSDGVLAKFCWREKKSS